MEILSQKISSIIENNFVFAKALHYFGVKFYEHTEDTLQQLCERKGIKQELVIKEFENLSNVETLQPDALKKYDIDFVLAYLKHTHHTFIKNKLPYIVTLIKDLDEKVIKESKIEDLHLIFPYFVEDFIRHIYEEEDSLFVYLDALIKAANKDTIDDVLLKMLKNNEVSNYFMHHSADDDMMNGVRELTNDYSSSNKSVQLNVLYKELKAFDDAVLLHAKIENDILFPLAIQLEQKIKNKLTQPKV